MQYVMIAHETNLTRAISTEVDECDDSGEIYFFMPENDISELRVGKSHIVIMDDERQVNVFVSGLQSVHYMETLPMSMGGDSAIRRLFSTLKRNASIEFDEVACSVQNKPRRLVLVSGEIEWTEKGN